KRTVLREGDFFGETELLTQLPASYQARVLESCEVLVLEQSFFYAILSYYVPVKYQLLTMLSIRNPGLMKSVVIAYDEDELKQLTLQNEQLPQAKDKWMTYFLWLGCGFAGLSFLALFVSNFGVRIAA